MKRAPILAALLGAGPSPVAAEPPTVDLHAHGELIAGAIVSSTAGLQDRRFTLERAEVGAGVVVGDRATGELVLEAVRSAGPDSAAGIDGNSILARLKRAALGGRADLPGAVELTGSLGLVADPWLAALGDFPLRALGVAVAEDQGLVASSDLGLSVTARHRGLARLTLAVTNGEGAHQVERNQGKDTAVVATVRPPLARLGLGVVELHLYGRDGSRGPASLRSHRVGGAVLWHHPRAAAGVDLLRAWGVGDHADVSAWAVEAWADVRLYRALGLTVRWDRTELTGPPGGDDAPDRWRVASGIWLDLAGAVRVLGAVQLERAGPGAPLAGLSTATDATRFMILAQGSFSTTP